MASNTTSRQDRIIGTAGDVSNSVEELVSSLLDIIEDLIVELEKEVEDGS